ncbi:MAG: serine hydrolase domain-containing protein [Nocardioidaceae bacterium]
MRDQRSRPAAAVAVLVLCLTVLLACSETQPRPGQQASTRAAPGDRDTRATVVRRMARELVRSGSAPGVVVVLRRGPRVQVVTEGLADTASGAPMSARARFHVASLTKPVVATVVMQLVQFGRLSLDDTVESWLPGLVGRGRLITVRQLLDHTSGLPDYTDVPAAWPVLDRPPVDQRALVVAAGRAEPSFAPGAGQKYSNTDYALLGLVVERVTGRRLEDVVESRVLTPLGLASASLRASRVREEPLVHGYVHGTDATDWDLTWGWAAGGLVTDGTDVDRFFAGLFAGDLVSPRIVEEMAEPAAGALGAWSGYGLGLAELPTPCGPAVGHSGVVDGYVSAAYTNRHDGSAVVLLVNTDRSLETGPLHDLLTTALCGPS